MAGNSLTIVDPSSGQIVPAAPLPGRPRWTVYDPGRDRFLVNIQEPALVAVVDPESATVIDTWSVFSAGPHGLALDGPGGRLFVACDGGDVVCLSTADGRELARVSIAGEPDAIWYDDASSSLYVAIGSPGLIQVIDTNRMAVSDAVATEEGSKTTALDARLRVLYVFKPGTCAVAAFHII